MTEIMKAGHASKCPAPRLTKRLALGSIVEDTPSFSGLALGHGKQGRCKSLTSNDSTRVCSLTLGHSRLRLQVLRVDRLLLQFQTDKSSRLFGVQVRVPLAC